VLFRQTAGSSSTYVGGASPDVVDADSHTASAWRLLGVTRSASYTGVLAVFDQSVVSGTNFISALLVVRSCTTAEFGTYVLIFGVLALLVDLQNAVISTPHTVTVPSLPEERRPLFTGSTLVHQFGFAAVIGGVLAVSAAWLAQAEGNVDMAAGFGVLAATVWALLLREYVRRAAFALDRIREAVVVDGAAAAIQLTTLAALAGTGTLTVARAYCVSAAAAGLAAGVWLVFRRAHFRLDLRASVTVWKVNWPVGRWALASGALWTANNSIYLWALTRFHGAHATAAWGACLGVMSFLNPLLLGLQNWLAPRTARSFAAGGHRALRRFLARASWMLCALLLPPVAVIGLFGRPLLAMLYGLDYETQAAAMWPLGVVPIAAALGYAASRGLFALRRARLDSGINLATLSISVSLGTLLTASHGVIGAAYGLALSGVVAMLFRYGALLKLATR
jgi:O-antigen/teichoic acid export membrane protein